jgi:hypothetical protein
MPSNDYTWDDITIAAEPVNIEDIKKAESGSSPVAGKYLVECIESSPQRSNWGKYTVNQVLLKFQIVDIIDIVGSTDSSNWSDLKGRFLWDRIALFDPAEANGTKNRRHLVANRLGLLDDKSELTVTSWSDDVIGKQVILTVEDNTYEKDGVKKTNLKVPFSGYERPSSDLVAAADPLADL